MKQLNPYINFSGNCREAMVFYKEHLGGELTLNTIGGSPIEAECPAGMKDNIMHSTLERDGSALVMGSDMTGPGGLIKGNNMSISISCSSEEEINRLYNAFSEGGKIECALMDSFWGSRFAFVVDKFGIGWMFNYEKPKS